MIDMLLIIGAFYAHPILGFICVVLSALAHAGSKP